MLVILVSLVNEVPHNQHRHHRSLKLLDADIISELEWVNPCATERSKLFNETSNETELKLRNKKLLKPLRDSLQNFIIRLNGPKMHAIDTSDISDWFKYNSTYSFLQQIDATTEPVNLSMRHRQTQKYIGAFQYLATKQNNFDILHIKEGNDVTIEIYHLLTLAKNLLCEIETVIINSRQQIPIALTRERMHKVLTFRNNHGINRFSCDIDELDIKFTKIRFHEYMHNLQRVLNRPRKKNIRRRSLKNNVDL